MDVKIAYEPDNFKDFKGVKHLKNYLNSLMRTDIGQKWTNNLTKDNIYLVRQGKGELEYFTNVTTWQQRVELKRMVLQTISDVPVGILRQDIVPIGQVIPKAECLETLEDIIEDILPGVWRQGCPFKGMEGLYLASTVCMVLHADQSYDGDVLEYHIHRLYVTDKKHLMAWERG